MTLNMQNTLVFSLDLAIDDNRLAQACSLLSAAERQRADRYQVETARRQFICCRAVLKLLLSQQVGCKPEEIHLTPGRFGKPYLRTAFATKDRQEMQDSPRATAGTEETINAQGKSNPSSQLHFNVSHSGNLGLIGISPFPIGIDLEQLTPRIQPRSLVSMILSHKELASWRRLSPSRHLQQIIDVWVCKEALLKAMGLGIADCLQQVSFPIPLPEDRFFCPDEIDASIQIHLEEEGNCLNNPWMIASFWKIHPLKVSPHHAAFAAIFQGEQEVVCRNFEWTELD
jgi:phosphopantetheinyl transferase